MESLDKIQLCLETISLFTLDPMELFRKWHQDAKGEPDNVLPEQVILATIREDGAPSARTVIMRGLDNDGFKMYWDVRSRKSQEINLDNRGALVFVWYFRDDDGSLGLRQARAEGRLERISRQEEVDYFNTEPPSAQIRATACHQSSIVQDRETTLEESKQLLEQIRQGNPLPAPPNYAGYKLVPDVLEFYQGRKDAINDRIKFIRLPEGSALADMPEGTRDADNGWVYQQLQP